MSVFGTGESRRAGLDPAPEPEAAPEISARDRIAAVKAAARDTDAGTGSTADDRGAVAASAAAPASAAMAAGSSAAAQATNTPSDLAAVTLPALLETAPLGAIDISVSPLSPLAADPAGPGAGGGAGADEPEIEAKPIWIVTASRVNVRQGPSTRYSVMAKISRGQQADVIEILDNGWALIRTENGQRGYMSADFLRKQDQQG